MDPSRFTDAKTGELVRIEMPVGKDWAFIPHPLPRGWRRPDALADLLGDARERLGKLDGIGRTLSNPMLLLTPLQQREAIRSSSLEGTDVHPMELLQYQLDPKAARSPSDERNAWREVSNHNTALLHGYKRLGELPLCGRLIKELHTELLSSVRGREKRPGEYRTRQVHIGSDRRFVPPPSNELARLMKALEVFLNDKESSTNPLVRAYMAHYQFEAIHPFLDGNGRIGRVLLSLCTYLWHDHAMPWLYMSAYFDRYKDEYVDNLLRVSTHGDWERWIEFCLRGTVAQCDDAILRCSQLHALRDRYHARLDAASPRVRAIVDMSFDWPVFRIGDLMRWCGTSRPTAQKDANALVSAGVALHLAGQRPRTYYMPEIMSVAYADDPIIPPAEG